MRFGRSTYRPTAPNAILIALVAVSGCASMGNSFSPKWAMENETYAEQYCAPDTHPHRSNTLRKMSRIGQQMTDARFQQGQAGLYAGAGIATKKHVALGGELGVFALPTSWSTMRVGAVGLLAEGLPSYLTGAVAGARIHAPTRFSPYVGLAGMAGYSQATTTAESSYVDGSGKLILKGDSIPGKSAALAAVIPEAGVSYWLTSKIRFNLGTSYYVTTGGRDFLFSGLSFEMIPGAFPDRPETRVQTSSPELDQVMESEPYFKAEKDREAFENSIHVYDGGKILPSKTTETTAE